METAYGMTNNVGDRIDGPTHQAYWWMVTAGTWMTVTTGVSIYTHIINTMTETRARVGHC